MRVLSSGSLTVQTCSASRGAVEAGGRRPVVPGVGPSAAEEDAFPRRCREPLLRRTLVRERAEREEGRLAQQQGAAPAGAAQRVEDRAGKGNHGGGARTRHREARAKLRRQIGLPRPPRLPRERALRGADDGDVGAGEEERVPRERLLPRRSSRHLELRAERRRRPRAPRRLLLELGEQRLGGVPGTCRGGATRCPCRGWTLSQQAGALRCARVSPAPPKPWTAARKVVACPLAPGGLPSTETTWYMSACAHRAGGGNCIAVKSVPRSAGTLSKAQAWTTSTPAVRAASECLSWHRSMNSGSPHRSQ